MYLNFQATQTDASRAGDSSIQMHPSIRSCTNMHLCEKESYLSKKEAQSSLEAGESKGEEKWMKPEARKLHKAVTNKNVF
jgi:hypothetical protein